MDLCNDGHEEVCYTSVSYHGNKNNCPVCQMLEEKQDEIDVLNEKIIELEEKLEGDD